jgi:glucuronate isomerase
MTSRAPLELHPDRVLQPEHGVRAIARRLYEAVDPRQLLDDDHFTDPATLLVTPTTT